MHSDLKWPITFGNWFWHLIVGNRSIVLNFYQQRPVFALKNHPRPQRPKRPMKANKGQHSPKLQISLLLSLFNVKSSTNVNTILKKMCFKKVGNFHFHYINFLKLHFVEFIKYTNRYQWYIGIGSFICLYITWKKWNFIHKFPPMEILSNIWWKSLKVS